MNFAILLVSSLLGASFALITSHFFKLRYLLFCVLVFLSIARLPLGASDESSLSLRIPLVLMLLIGSYRSLPATVDAMYRRRILLWPTLWFLYVGLFWFYSIGSRVSIYEHAGNFVFFLLTVSMFSRVDSKQLKRLMILIALTQVPGILMGVKELRPPLLSIGFNWGTVYHQRSAQAGVYLLPVLLFWLDRITHRKVLSYAVVIVLILSLFIIVITTGARTPTLVFGLTLIYWLRRDKKYIVILSIVTIAGFYISQSVTPEETSDRYVRAYGAIASGNLNEAANVEFRYEHLIIGLRAFSESPVFGHGHNSWMAIIGSEKGIIGYNLAPHNEVVRLMVEYGVVGIYIFAMYIYTCCRKVPSNAKGDFVPAARYTFMVMAVSMVLLNFFHNSLFTRHFFFILGASSGLFMNPENTYYGKVRIGNVSAVS